MKKTIILLIALFIAGCNAGTNKHIVLGVGNITTSPSNVRFQGNGPSNLAFMQRVFASACPNRVNASLITKIVAAGHSPVYVPGKSSFEDNIVNQMRERKGFCEGAEGKDDAKDGESIGDEKQEPVTATVSKKIMVVFDSSMSEKQAKSTKTANGLEVRAGAKELVAILAAAHLQKCPNYQVSNNEVHQGFVKFAQQKYGNENYTKRVGNLSKHMKTC